MKTLSRVILPAAAVAALSWFLPWLYALAFPKSTSEPFCAFSPVSGKWVTSQSAPGSGQTILEINADGKGEPRQITREERDSLLPQLFYRELLAHDNLPDSVGGLEVNAHNLRTREMMLTSSPRDIVKRGPGVWMMMESMPRRVDLSDADQVFRFTSDGGMEFVDMASNSVNATRSKRFTETLHSRGFKFPARDLSANVTAKKQYDEGYLMIDDKGDLFHVKQQAGRPYAASITLPEGKKASKAFILEEANRDFIGLVTDTDDNLYIIERLGYRPARLDVGKVNPREEQVLMMGNMFNIVFRFTGADGIRWRAVNLADYSPLGALDIQSPRSAAAKAADYIFPYTLSFVSINDSLAYPRLARFSAKALALNCALALILVVVAMRRRRDPWTFAGAALTLPLGIYAFIPFLLIND